jgi:hypothetical protein
MKDIESTVSELSGLYDMISANVNPFIDIPKMDAKASNGPRAKEVRPPPPPQKGKEFVELSEIFEEVEEVDERPPKSAQKGSGDDLGPDGWLLRWTQFLLGKVGREGLEKALDYYKDLGWIDEDIIDRVLEMARGTSAPTQAPERKAHWRMDAEDHMRSLEHIRRIRGKGPES